MKKVYLFLVFAILFILACGCSQKDYRLVKRSGNYYIQLSDKLTPSDPNSDLYMATLAPVVRFDSLDEMISDIRNGRLQRTS